MQWTGRRPTVANPRKRSSRPKGGAIVNLTQTLMKENSKTQDKPNAAAMIIHALWSVSVTTAKGGDCPSGTVGADMTSSLEDRATTSNNERQ